MDLLTYYYQNRPSNDFSIPRKCTFSNDSKINLYGPRGSGKSTLALEYMLNFDKKNTLYIDFDDPNLIFEEILEAKLREFVLKNGIELLVCDHCREMPHWNFDFVNQAILISRKKLSPLWSGIKLGMLDYEEFLGSEHTISQSNGFSHFFKSGGIPAMAKNQKTHTSIIKNFLQSRFSDQEIRLLGLIARHNTKHITINQLYAFAKKEFKISKDWLYSKIDSFVDEGVVLFFNDISQKGGKKILLYDIALARYLTAFQPFVVYFDTLIGLHLSLIHISEPTRPY